jgi:hypothetical protein
VSKRSGPTPRRATPREIEGIPGTVEPGFREQPIKELVVSREVIDAFERMGVDSSTLHQYRMGPCSILVAREPVGSAGELRWHMTISTPSRHPTWDEIKVARYRLMPHDVICGILLPPPEQYVNVPEQDHVFRSGSSRSASDRPTPWYSSRASVARSLRAAARRLSLCGVARMV